MTNKHVILEWHESKNPHTVYLDMDFEQHSVEFTPCTSAKAADNHGIVNV